MLRSAETPYLYRAFGLSFTSELPFSGLQQGLEPADFAVRYGEVPEKIESPLYRNDRFQATHQKLLLRPESDSLAFYIRDGQEVRIEHQQSCDYKLLQSYLFGSAFAALLMQRGMVLLHASVVARDGCAYAFMGKAGSGKSTLAAAFCAQDFRVVSDDLCAISFSESGTPLVHSGYGTLKLLPPTLKKLDISSQHLESVHLGGEKKVVPLTHAFCHQHQILRGIYELCPTHDAGLEIKSLSSLDSLLAVLRFPFRKPYVKGLGLERDTLEKYTKLVRSTFVRQIVRSRQGFDLELLVEKIKADLQK